MKTGSIIKKGIILLAILVTILSVCTLNGNDLINRDPFFLLLHPLEIFHPDDNGGYIVTPAIGPIGEGEIVDNSGPDKTITFWELPLWIQLSVISGAAFSTFTLLKCFPILLGKILSGDINPKLQEIVSYITENPGCLESEISRDLDIKRGTLRYYISRLASDNRIQTIKKGKIKGIFHITCSKTDDQKLLHLHRKNKNRKQIIQIITERPGITGQELSSHLNIDKSTVHWHITELKKDDLICTEKDGRSRRYYSQLK